MYKQSPKSVAMKTLVGNQIEAAPGKMMDSPVKQTQSRDHYYDLKPKDAITYADSAAVETRHALASSGSGARRSSGLGEVAGKAASGGKFSQGNFTTGSAPNSSKAKEFLKGQRNTQAEYGIDYKDAYQAPTKMKSPTKQTKKKLTPKQKQALRQGMGEISKENFRKRGQEPGTKKPVTPKPEPKKPSSSSRSEYLKKVKYNKNGKL